MDFISELTKIYDLQLLVNENMKKHTSYMLGGNAKYFVNIKSLYSLNMAINLAKRYKVKYKVIGNGSNLLVSDLGFNGIVFCVKNLCDIFFKQDEIYAMCGANLNSVINFAYENSLSGLESLYGIPATVGGAVYMNAGAFGNSISNYIKVVETIRNGKLYRYDVEDCGFSYRKSKFMRSRETIVSATFSLNKSSKEQIKFNIEQFIKRRKQIHPYQRSCGSVFKNPKGQHAGQLIERAGLKGYGNNKCHVSKKHGNFIVVENGATAFDVYSLILHIKKEIKKQFGINLKEEVELLGDFNVFNI